MHLPQDTGGQFSIKYGTGAVRGRVVTDVLRFSQPPIVVPDQGFGLATEHSADFASASCDGIFVSPALSCTRLDAQPSPAAVMQCWATVT